MSRTLKQLIAEIPGEDGWWKSGSEKCYGEMAVKLVSLGMTEKEAADFLHNAYWSAADCYGA